MSNISITSLFPFRRLKFIGSEDINFEEDTGKVIELKPDMRFTPIVLNAGVKELVTIQTISVS